MKKIIAAFVFLLLIAPSARCGEGQIQASLDRIAARVRAFNEQAGKQTAEQQSSGFEWEHMNTKVPGGGGNKVMAGITFGVH